MAKEKFVNNVSLEGFLYEHKLEIKTTGAASKNPGVEYITGTISIATDPENCVNIVPVHFTYVVPFFPAKDGNPPKENRNYPILKKIYDGELKTVVNDGKNEAAILHVDTSLDLNEWYTDRTDEIIKTARNEGGFINVKSEISESEVVRNHFEADTIITKVIRKDADDEKKIPENIVVSGFVLNFKKELMPFEFVSYKPAAMDYFEDLGATEKTPVFTKIWGAARNTTVTTTKIEESAFGEPEVKESKSTRREYIITGAAKNPYVWDDESSMLASEYEKKLADREMKLATIKAETLKAKSNTTTMNGNDFGF